MPTGFLYINFRIYSIIMSCSDHLVTYDKHLLKHEISGHLIV